MQETTRKVLSEHLENLLTRKEDLKRNIESDKRKLESNQRYLCEVNSRIKEIEQDLEGE